ncbi:MAG: hypothetical protein WC956_11150 [bacterium]
MKKTNFALFGLAVICVVVLGMAVCAQAGQYTRPTADQPMSAIGVPPEQTRSMTDCQSYCTNLVTKGQAADKAEFKRQYKEPIGQLGSSTEYNYDKYTKIFLDCPTKTCTCRCVQGQ